MKYAIIFATLLLSSNVAINAGKKDNTSHHNEPDPAFFVFLGMLVDTVFPDIIRESLEKHSKTIVTIEKIATDLISKIENEQGLLEQKHLQEVQKNIQKFFNPNESSVKSKQEDELVHSLFDNYTKKLLLVKKVAIITLAQEKLEKCKETFLPEIQKPINKRDSQKVLEGLATVELYDDLLPLMKEDLEKVMSDDFLPKSTK